MNPAESKKLQPAPTRVIAVSKQALLGYGFAFGAALAYAGAQVLTKQGIKEWATPMVGALVSLLTGAAVLFFMGLGEYRGVAAQKMAVGYILLSGLFSAAGVALFYYTLSIAPVVIVSPLVSTHPLFAILFSYLFLRSLERITWRLVLGVLLVVAGIAVIAISPALE